MKQVDTAHAAPGDKPGFTLWPAQTSGNDFNDSAGGTESFLSSTAADEAQCTSGVACSGTSRRNVILDWNLTGTSTLNTTSPSVLLANIPVRVDRYAIPPKSNQKAGDFPLGQCINDTTAFGAGCWQLFFDPPAPAHTEVISHPDSNDTRMQQVTYANGKLWGALDTDVVVRGVHKAGIAWFIIRPRSGDRVNQGTLALKGNNVTYPAIGVTSDGRGVMAFTVIGDDHYPSAGYAGIVASHGTGAVHIAAEGLGPDDGFSGYAAFSNPPGSPPRTRWGDYGAAAVDGNSIWIASEYVAQTCTLAQYLTGAIGSCGGTRTALANWATRISKVTP